jgi:hypothetical protein
VRVRVAGHVFRTLAVAGLRWVIFLVIAAAALWLLWKVLP